MNQLKVIVTGTTGMVGEGVLRVCLSSPQVSEVLSVSRKPTGISHPKLQEYIVPDFLDLQAGDSRLTGYDACFYCAGVTSLGKSEADYTRITFDTTLHFAKILAAQNPGMTFTYVSGAGTDSTEKGRLMWARVKGRTENALLRLPFRKVHNFRPGFIKPLPEQQYVQPAYKYVGWLYPLLKRLLPNTASTIQHIAQAMITCATTDAGKPVMEVGDMRQLG